MTAFRVFAATSLAMLHAWCIGELRAEDARPNIVIVLADDMGYGDPGCYNPDSKCPTPNIDALAAAGMQFTDAHAGGAWCTPSRYSLLTGRYAFRTSLKWQQEAVIKEGVKTVADTLRDAGYQTAMVGKWHLGFEDAKNFDFAEPLRGGPCDRGFDDYFGLPASLDIPDFYWIEDRRVPNPPTVLIADSNSEPADWNPIQGKFWRGGKRGEDFEMEACLDRIGSEAVKRIASMSKNAPPFFLSHNRNGDPFLSKDVLNPDLADPKSTAGQLYFLATDPGEATNLWNERPDVVRKMTAKLRDLTQNR